MAASDLTEPDPVARFDLLATAVAEQLVAVRTGTAVPTHTDVRTIWINHTDALDDIERVREAVLVQALLLRHGGLDRGALRRLGRASTAARYFGFEVRRALALGSPVPLVGRIVNAAGVPPVSSSARESLDWARGRSPSEPTPPHWGTLLPAAVHGHLTENDLADAASNGVGTDMLTLTTRRIRKGAKGRRKGNGSGIMLDGWSSRAAVRLGTAGTVAPPPSTSSISSDGATLHPEWDVRRGAYRADWCRVREQPVPQRHNVTVTRSLPDPQLRSGMARLARSLTRVDGQREGDDIDLDAVIDRQVSRLAGHFVDHGVYFARLPIKPELTVMILMDASSSTAEPLRDGRTVFDEQRACAAALIDAMTAVGLSTAWWTFRSQGRHAVGIEKVKTFDQPADYDLHARAAMLRPSGFTRLGAAIRHATMAIDTRAGAGHRLLLVLSDGVAFDHGYDGNHADSDVRMALAEARSRQIGCLSLSVGVEHDDTGLRDTFGAEDYLRFSSWDTLRGDLTPLLNTAIRATG